MAKKKLTPIEYSAKYSKAYISKTCADAGTTYEYWKRIRDLRQRPGVDLARALVDASGGELSFDALVFEKDARRKTGAPRMAVPTDPEKQEELSV